MDLSKFTIKSQQILGKAQQIALGESHAQLENGHLLKAIFEEDDNVTPFLLKKMNVNVGLMSTLVDSHVASFSKVSQTQHTASRNLSETIMRAQNYAQKQKDEFVSVDLLMISNIGIFAIVFTYT